MSSPSSSSFPPTLGETEEWVLFPTYAYLAPGLTCHEIGIAEWCGHYFFITLIG